MVTTASTAGRVGTTHVFINGVEIGYTGRVDWIFPERVDFRSPGADRIRKTIRDDDYAVLGCSPGDPPEKLRREWRRLAKIHHPDHGGDAETFRRIREAYARLKRAGKG